MFYGIFNVNWSVYNFGNHILEEGHFSNWTIGTW